MGKVLDQLWEKAGKQKIPITGAFELLPTCNLACKMCYVRKSEEEVKKAGGLMPTDFWLDIAKQARDNGLLFPLLTGGEPFLRDDIKELLAKMVEMGLQVSINSNGTLLDESIIKWMRKYCPTRINVTMYGASEETYERLCGDGDAYNRMRRAVDWMKYYGIPVKFNASITQYNLDDMDAMILYAKKMESPVQVATYMFPPIRRNKEMIGKNNRLTPEEAARAKVRADWLQQDPTWFLGQVERFSHFIPVNDEMLKKQENDMPHEITCRAGRCSFWVDWRGNLGNCGMHTYFSHSLEKQSFVDAWKDIVDETNELRFSSVCTNCPNYWLCHVCVSMVLNETGKLDGRPEYICKMTEKAAKYYKEYAQKLSGMQINKNKIRPDEYKDICEI